MRHCAECDHCKSIENSKGENCKYCWCAKCRNINNCGEFHWNIEEYCQEECSGGSVNKSFCADYERSD